MCDQPWVTAPGLGAFIIGVLFMVGIYKIIMKVIDGAFE